MLYPIHVHKDRDSAYGASFPDFPGCFAGADELQDLPRAAQEAVEAHFHGETEAIPSPSAPEAWEGNEDFEEGFWMMVDIDLSKVSTKAVRLNISLPENLVHRIDAVAKAQRLSRSAFLAKAAEREMAEA
ncbi:type II toxin-antitoxin system HicB family antitoxin [Castellaniella caeni]|uniref:type II toxin-antitoxin system HicB family antitoxin n=1 Tax=Castellaniella caeni TaxID=266123 RepID=UPI00082CC899|nr:type II toxin-antitoxin system HicB family antitoxin [Castellaniella caeni]